MITLADFLLARIAEDEEGARADWDRQLSGIHTDRPRNDPKRMLAECEAKRRIVELHRLGGEYEPSGLRYCATCGSGEPYEYPTPWPCDTLKLLALPYADRPDYREEWRP